MPRIERPPIGREALAEAGRRPGAYVLAPGHGLPGQHRPSGELVFRNLGKFRRGHDPWGKPWIASVGEVLESVNGNVRVEDQERGNDTPNRSARSRRSRLASRLAVIGRFASQNTNELKKPRAASELRSAARTSASSSVPQGRK